MDDWTEYKLLILDQLKKLEVNQSNIENKIDLMHEEIITNRAKNNVFYGSLIVIITPVIDLLILKLFK